MLGGLLGTNTPPYKGPAQNVAQKRGGLIGLITGLIGGGGGGTPAYVGEGHAVRSNATGFSLFPTAPAYVRATPKQIAPTGAPVTEPSPPSEEHVDNAEECQVKKKGITIIVKPGPGTTVEEVMQFLHDHGLDTNR